MWKVRLQLTTDAEGETDADDGPLRIKAVVAAVRLLKHEQGII